MEQYLGAMLAPSTASKYKREYQQYRQFCDLTRQPHNTEHSICLFVTHRADVDKYPAIAGKVAAINHHLKVNLEQQPMPTLTNLLEGIKRTLAPHQAQCQRLPIRPRELRQIKSVLRKFTEHNSKMLWAATLISYFGCTRISEIASKYTRQYRKNHTLLVQDVSITNNQLSVFIRAAKTDQYCTGATVIIAENGTDICPVHATTDYLKHRANKPGPFFLFDDGTCLTPQRFNTFLHQCLPNTNAGTYSAHSLRIGAATVAAEMGYSKEAIQALGRWRSDAYIKYLRFGSNMLLTMSKNLATS